MSHIIHIQKLQLNNEEVNSVNARDLHHELNISKKFSDWIKAQIKRADLEENVDYIFASLLGEAKKGSGGHNQKEYILTLESAKHIAMMSQSKKAKEIRNYFIEVERKYIEELKSNSLQLHTLKKELTQHIDEKLNNFSEILNDYHLGSKKASFFLQRATSIMDQATEAIQDLPLDKDQLKLIREEISHRGRHIASSLGISSESAIPALYIKLNKHFDVSSYHEIPRSSYYLAINFIRTANL